MVGTVAERDHLRERELPVREEVRQDFVGLGTEHSVHHFGHFGVLLHPAMEDIRRVELVISSDSHNNRVFSTNPGYPI